MLFVNFFVKCLKSVPKLPLSYFLPELSSYFVTIATVVVKLLPDYYNWAIVHICSVKSKFDFQPHIWGKIALKYT